MNRFLLDTNMLLGFAREAIRTVGLDGRTRSFALAPTEHDHAVVERMDADELVVEGGGDDDRMLARGFLIAIPVEEIGHRRLHLIRRREVIDLPRRGLHVVRRGFVVAERNRTRRTAAVGGHGLGFVGFLQQYAMGLHLGQPLFFLYGTLDGLDGIVMPLDVEMVPDRFAVGGEAVERWSGSWTRFSVSVRPGRARPEAADATRRARS